MTDPIRLTSSGHPTAIFNYLGASFVGVATIAGLTTVISMTEILGKDGVTVWAGVTSVAGLIAAAIALIGRFDSPTESRLRIEWVSLTILFLSYLWYEITLVIGNGFGNVVVTQVLAHVIFLGCGARAIEIIIEIRRVRRGPKLGD